VSTELVAVLLAAGGVLAVLAVAYAFYRVGRSEDRDRAAAEAARREDEAPPPGEIARERSRPRPPRRPG
jgi:hypothetical protein